jgi:hypothetical protein
MTRSFHGYFNDDVFTVRAIPRRMKLGSYYAVKTNGGGSGRSLLQVIIPASKHG